MVNLKLDNGTVDHADVEKYCMDHNSSLVSFQSRKEFNFVSDILDRNHFQQKGIDFWVGATRPLENEGFKWEDDKTAFDVFKWAEGEPSVGKKCLQLFKDNSNNWVYKTEDCDDQDDDGSFICEKPSNIK